MVAAGERIGQVPQAISALEQDLVAKASTSKKVRHIPIVLSADSAALLFLYSVLCLWYLSCLNFDAVLEEMSVGCAIAGGNKDVDSELPNFLQMVSVRGSLGIGLLILVCAVHCLYSRQVQTSSG